MQRIENAHGVIGIALKIWHNGHDLCGEAEFKKALACVKRELIFRSNHDFLV
jgi:hypothetical protein